MPEQEPYDNAFKDQWEMFLRRNVLDEPFPWTLLQGAKGVLLAEPGLESWAKRAWLLQKEARLHLAQIAVEVLGEIAPERRKDLCLLIF